MAFWRRLGTIRGRLVLWYLSVLAILLLALGVFLATTLSSYLRTTTATGMREGAFSGLHALGPCFILSSVDLNNNAQTLAQLLGSRDTAVKIVTPSGETLADHGLGPLGASRPLRLSATTIRRLISSTTGEGQSQSASTPAASCQPAPSASVRRANRHEVAAEHPALIQGDLILVAVPLGPFEHPVGYALLGRSFAQGDATIRRTEIVFALGALVALFLAALVALPLINQALRPLRRIASTAGLIAAGDLQRRANLPDSPDEIGRLGTAFDAMVDRLQAALLAANESEERMRRFLADASHELRTPLTILRGTSEVLLRRAAKEHLDSLDTLQDLHDEAVQLSKLVDDLLTLTRLDAGQALNPEPVRIRAFLEQFAERYARAWPARDIDLELRALNGSAAYVDPDALRRMLTNLIDNAARYSTPGKPITLAGESTGETVRLSVKDEGPGLDPDEATRVFERFYRSTQSRAHHSGGTGLGLSIVQALARGSGGQVTIDTGSDRGTTVTITLPKDRVTPSGGSGR